MGYLGSYHGLGRLWSYPGEILGVMSLNNLYGHGNLMHPGKNSSKQVLMTKMWLK